IDRLRGCGCRGASRFGMLAWACRLDPFLASSVRERGQEGGASSCRDHHGTAQEWFRARDKPPPDSLRPAMDLLLAWSACLPSFSGAGHELLMVGHGASLSKSGSLVRISASFLLPSRRRER